jgi:hypothetical protein
MDNKKLILTQKQFQIYELINKIQTVINTESLLPQFIYFAKNMEEMRKKWQYAESKCKELENKLIIEKSIFQRKINELKIDIEVHNEKRLQAENRSEKLQHELEKMHKQFELFKDVLQGDKRSMYDDRINVLSNYDLNNMNNQANLNIISNTPYKTSNTNINMNNYDANKIDEDRIIQDQHNNGIEDTGSFNISDYTEDDIDVPNDENIIENNTHQIFTNGNTRLNTQSGVNIGATTSNNIINLPTQPSSISLQDRNRERERNSNNDRKRSQRYNSASLTRNGGERREKKRSRTRSTDMPIKEGCMSKPPSRSNLVAGANGITAITTLQIDQAGRPITVTSEIKHNNPEGVKQQHTEINPNSNKMELSFVTTSRCNKNRKKRPSREFLQRSADESETTEDSDIFWNGTDAVMDELTTKTTNLINNNNVHIMTPIVEAATPVPHSKISEPHSQRLYSNNVRRNLQQQQNSTPSSGLKMMPKVSIPLTRRYKRAHSFKSQVILNTELCAHCDKRLKFGKMILKCKECEMVVHVECRDSLQRPCYPMVSFPVHGLISDYVISDESPHVPPILQMIVHEIETRGLLTHEVGLYRVNGSDSQIKQLKERLIKRHQPPDLRKINDVHVLCSFVKDFLNNFLTEHLITYDSWYRFAKACGNYFFFILSYLNFQKYIKT